MTLILGARLVLAKSLDYLILTLVLAITAQSLQTVTCRVVYRVRGVLPWRLLLPLLLATLRCVGIFRHGIV